MKRYVVLPLLMMAWLALVSSVLLDRAAGATSGVESSQDSQFWFKTFRGVIRIWQCDWLVDNKYRPLRTAISVSVTEQRFLDRSYERLRVNWQFPTRPDLTPDLDYNRVTADSAVLAKFNDRGARAVVVPSPGYSVEKTSLYEFFGNPIAVFVSKDFCARLSDLSWRPVDPAQLSLSLDDKRISKKKPREGGSLEFLRGETIRLGARGERMEAHMLHSPSSFGERKPQTTALDTDASRVAALDVKYDIRASPQMWNGLSESSYRVLQWQQADQVKATSSQTKVKLPRLCVWEETCVRPRLPHKNYHRIVVMLIDIEPGLGQNLTDWESMLPEMRIADLRTGAAKVSNVKRDDCAAWRFIKSISGVSSEFRNLLASRLESSYPGILKPVLSIAQGRDAVEYSIGSMRQAHGYQVVESLGSQKTNVTDAPKPQTQAAESPAILEIVSGVRAAISKETAETSFPRRAGFKAVNNEEHRVAQTKLSTLMVGAGVLGSVTLLLFFLGRRKGG